MKYEEKEKKREKGEEKGKRRRKGKKGRKRRKEKKGEEKKKEKEKKGITKLMIYLNEKMYKDSIVGYEVMKKKTIWGYKAEPIKVIKITFNKLVSMYTCRKLLRTKIEGKKYECHEAEVSQITKYQTEKDLLYGEWMEGEGCQIINPF